MTSTRPSTAASPLRATPPRPTGPDPVRLAGLLVRVWLEVQAGRRPLEQLAPLVSPAMRRRLAAQLRLGAIDHRTGPPPRLRRLVASTPTAGAREVTVLVDHAGRTTAFAVRMERHRGAWRAVELTAPEAGLPAIQTASTPEPIRRRDAFDEVFEEAGEALPPHLA